MKKTFVPQDYSQLIADLASLIERGRRFAARSMNVTLVVTYWLIGRRIVEYEQKGKKRAEYGKALLEQLGTDLSHRYGKGFSERNLELMRQFYSFYPIPQTLSAKSSKSARGSSQLFPKVLDTLARRFSLSWSRYCLIMRLEDPHQREFYERECIQGNWSVRQLDRQIQSLLYENDPIGLILCSDKDHTVVEYALGGMSNKIFASKYKLQLPDPETLKAEIEREKQKLLEMRIVKE